MSYHHTRWPILAVITVSIAGCPAIDKLAEPDKPSPTRLEIERRAALTLPAAEPEPLAEPEPVIQPVLFVQSVQEVETQPCNPVFRISYCDENGNEVML